MNPIIGSKSRTLRCLVATILLPVVFLAGLCGCKSSNYSVYRYDNGDDYVCEGVRRIVDDSGRIGFADVRGSVKIAPQYAFAFPFEGGLSKVAFQGRLLAEGEYHRWVSPEWFFVNHQGDIVGRERRYSQLGELLAAYVAGRSEARIGVAVIIDGKDTVAVNGREDFPMMSVFKFPQALAVAEWCMANGVGLTDTIAVEAEEIAEHTWSPMREHYGVRNLRLPVADLLGYSLRQSDNNACDVLFRLIGGPAAADSVMKCKGFDDIVIAHTEADMHREPELALHNSSTPMAMARLLDSFFGQETFRRDPVRVWVSECMTTCQTGLDRLSAPLGQTGATIAHKTGTGNTDSHGRITALNDAGHVILPDGHEYSIAVFIADSAYGAADTARMIAEISELVYQSVASSPAHPAAPASRPQK